MSKFLLFLKNPKVIGAFLFLLLFGLTWVLGSIVGLGPWARVLLIAVISGFTLIIGLIILLIQRTKAPADDRSSAPPADKPEAAPNRRGAVEGLGTQLQRALQELRGKNLSWYMVLGPLGSGKSTLLRHSGLEFPLLGVKDVGSHQNCKWWFTNEAVLLDTSGHYVNDNERKEEWLGFLDLLKKAPRETPIKGVIVAESIEDLIKLNEEEVEAQAKKIRNRLDELIQRLGILVPVYLVFTKCDALQGFSEFFSSFSEEERVQIWGCTLPRASEEQPELVFQSEFKQLYRPLTVQRLSQLGRERTGQNKYKVYAFPLQFAALQERLSHFVSVLFRPNQFQATPIFRGFYFSSAVQDGAAIDFVIGRLRRTFGFAQSPERAEEEEKEPTGYFITDLFYNVIFPDHVFTRLAPTEAEQGSRVKRLCIIAATALISLFIVIGSLISFFRNQSLATSVSEAANKAAKGRSRAEHLVGLSALRPQLKLLDNNEHKGRPFFMGWGMYLGSDLYESARTVYYNRLHADYLKPSLEGVKTKLKQLNYDPDGEDWTEHYNLLKTYLLFSFKTEKIREERPFLTDYLTKSVQPLPKDELSFYLDRLLDEVPEHRPRIPSLDSDGALVRNVRARLNRNQGQAAYAQLKALCAQVDSVSVAQVLQQGEGGTYLRSSSENKVPGCFTSEAWKRSISNAVREDSPLLKTDDWVLQEGTSSSAPVTRQVAAWLKNQYFKDYIAAWQRFLAGISVQPFGTITEAIKGLDVLASSPHKDSPMAQLFKVVDNNTQLEAEPGGGRRELVPQVAREFQSIHTLVGTFDGQNPYLLALTQIRNKLQNLGNPPDWERMRNYIGEVASASAANGFSDAQNAIDQLLIGFGPVDLKNAIKQNILEPPVKSALECMFRDSKQYLNKAWKEQVYVPWQNTLERKYPFDKEAQQDADLEDVRNFFRPSSGSLWKFVTIEAKSVLEQSGGKWRRKELSGASIPFSSAFTDFLDHAERIKNSLFLDDGTFKVPFKLRPQPMERQPEPWIVTRTILEVENKDNRPISYDMGASRDWELSWPPSRDKKVHLQIFLEGPGNPMQPSCVKSEGDWAWFKWLDKAHIKSQGSKKFLIRWPCNPPGAPEAVIKYELEADRSANPFEQDFFRKVKCPSEIVP